jgi:toxin ParE1/3/4
VTLEFHPRAVIEARAARKWYVERSVAAASQFVGELEHGVARITAVPEQWPAYLHGTRVYRLRRFPYLIVYREAAGAWQVIAVAHGRRKPGYWRKRLR